MISSKPMQRMRNGPVSEMNAKLANTCNIRNFKLSYVSILRIVSILDRDRLN